MKKLIFVSIMMLMFFSGLYAQTPASGYTANLSLKKYPSNATGIADSLNWNWDRVDQFWRRNYDSLLAHRSELNILGAQWQTLGSNIFYNTGNVGIGTNTPLAKLHVYYGTSGAPTATYSHTIIENSNYTGLQFKSPNTVGNRIYYSDPENANAGIFEYYHPSDIFLWSIQGTERMRLSATGLGIGVSPSYKLDVLGDINFTGTLRKSGTPFKEGLWSLNGSDVYYNGGNVGIGTSTPNYKLDINGKIGIDGQQTVYNADAEDGITGTIYIGDGGGSLTHTVDSEAYYNIAMGLSAGYLITTGYANTFIGHQAGASTTTGYSNTLIGYQVGINNISGLYNSFLGYQTGLNNTIGYANTFIGYQAGYSNIDGAINSFFGYQAGFSSTATNGNSFFGHQTGYNTTGGSNSFFGNTTGFSNTTGIANSFFGYETGYTNTIGLGNTFIGYRAGNGITTGNNNTIIGANVTGLSASLSNNVIIADGTGNQRIRILSNGDVGIGTATPSEKLTVEWAAGVDAGFFRGVTDPDITGIFTRNPNGVLYYVWVAAGGNLTTSTTKP